MALGKKRGPQQEELFIATAQILTGPGHPFYAKLNEVLVEAGFEGQSVLKPDHLKPLYTTPKWWFGSYERTSGVGSVCE